LNTSNTFDDAALNLLKNFEKSLNKSKDSKKTEGEISWEAIEKLARFSFYCSGCDIPCGEEFCEDCLELSVKSIKEIVE
jgi:hypothetical protein